MKVQYFTEESNGSAVNFLVKDSNDRKRAYILCHRLIKDHGYDYVREESGLVQVCDNNARPVAQMREEFRSVR